MSYKNRHQTAAGLLTAGTLSTGLATANSAGTFYRVDGLAWELNSQDQVEIVTQRSETITVESDQYIVHNNSLYVDSSIWQIIGALSGAGVFLLLALPSSHDEDTSIGLSWSDDDYAPSASYAVSGTDRADFFVDGDNSSKTATSTIDLGRGNDRVVISENAAENGSLSIDLGAGNDYAFFGDSAGKAGNLSIDSSDGDNQIYFADDAAENSGSIDVTVGQGNDILSFGIDAADEGGDLNIDLGGGNNSVSFGEYAGYASANIDLTTGDGNDLAAFADSAARRSGVITMDLGDGRNNISFADDTASIGGSLSITVGNDEDWVSIGNSAAASSGAINITTSGGDDVIVFGADASQNGGYIEISAGDGADIVQLGANAGSTSSTVLIDLGNADADADTVEFLGNATNVTIANLESGDRLEFSGAITSAVAAGMTSLSTGTATVSFNAVTGTLNNAGTVFTVS